MQFRNAGLVEVVLQALAKSRLAPERLEIEITEGVLLVTTAEGVETEAEFNGARLEGCTEVQGFLFGRAMKASDVTALLRPPSNVLRTQRDTKARRASPQSSPRSGGALRHAANMSRRLS